jgi:hypothetical protein
MQSLDKKYKVCIGSRQMCSCADGELCVHLLFVMLRVLGVPQANAVLWQHSLTDNELAAVLARKLGGADAEQAKHRFLRRGSAGDAAAAAAPRTLTVCKVAQAGPPSFSVVIRPGRWRAHNHGSLMFGAAICIVQFVRTPICPPCCSHLLRVSQPFRGNAARPRIRVSLGGWRRHDRHRHEVGRRRETGEYTRYPDDAWG